MKSLTLLAVLLAAVAPVAAAPAGGGALRFRGFIDGSSRIRISADAATWTLVDRGLSAQPCTLNDISWNPNVAMTLSNQGATAFLPGADALDFRHARLQRIRGRDLVAMECSAESLVVSLNDTPNGESEYEFRIVFPPRPRSAVLHITAEIDGSDELHISPDRVWWVHKQWDWPQTVSLNGVAWNPRENPVLPDARRAELLNVPLDFSTARLIIKAVRDMAILMPEDDGPGIVIHFADNPNGAALTDLTVIFEGR